MSLWQFDRAHLRPNLELRASPVRWSTTLVGALCAVGCAASQPATRASSAPPPAPLAAAPGELRMRHPDEVRSSAAPSSRLGVLEPVNAAKPLPESRPPQPRAARARAPRPILLAPDSVPRAYAVRHGRLTLPSGLILHHVPKSVSVRLVREQGGGDVWELTDLQGRRLALLKVESLARMPFPSGERLDELASARSVDRRSDWGEPRVRVVSERILSEGYVYTIERRAKGTAWIASGLELEGRDD